MSQIDGLPSLAYIEGLFRIAREHGVHSFSCEKFHVAFMEVEFEIDDDLVDDEPEPDEPRVPNRPPVNDVNSVYRDPRLWNTGTPPYFPEPGDGLPEGPDD